MGTRPTIQMVAELAGVSRGTVDRVLNDRPHVNEEVRQRVLEAMRQLGLTERDLPQVLMVGDRKFDVLGARACGVDCAGVEFFGYAPPGELEEAGAVAVVKTPEELEEFILSH